MKIQALGFFCFFFWYNEISPGYIVSLVRYPITVAEDTKQARVQKDGEFAYFTCLVLILQSADRLLYV